MRMRRHASKPASPLIAGAFLSIGPFPGMSTMQVTMQVAEQVA